MKAKDLDVILSSLGRNNYEKVFYTMYGNCYETCRDWKNIVFPRLEVEHNFLKVFREYEKTIENELALLEKAKICKKVTDFKKEYSNWTSGYSMGEKIVIEYITNNRRFVETFKDNRQYYEGRRAQTYNKNIVHGKLKLIVDMTGKKNKYTIEKIEKK